MLRRILTYTYWSIIHLFGLVGMIFLSVFVAMQLHLTDVPGTVDLASNSYQAVTEAARVTDTTQVDATKLVAPAVINITNPDLTIAEIDQQLTDNQQYRDSLLTVKERKLKTVCRITSLASVASVNARYVWQAYQTTASESLVDKMIFALTSYVTPPTDCEDDAIVSATTLEATTTALDQGAITQSVYPWVNAAEWPVLNEALIKDSAVLTEAATAAGISPRLVASALVVEQLRLYHTQREYYEKFFEPLKILANATQFAWGVMSIKEGAARQIEQHLTDVNSPYYLGVDYQHSLDFTSTDTNTERFQRLSDEHNHYYSYLYGGLYLKQFITQWHSAGYEISDRPEIVATLFNLGFEHSNPKVDPQVGGSTITIGGRNYSFGALAYEFYYSGELMDQFPY